MADEHDGPVELVDERPEMGGVARDPAQGIRRRENRVLVTGEPVEHGPPARSVSESAVNENNRWLGHDDLLVVKIWSLRGPE
jgi:hypothetical protein